MSDSSPKSPTPPAHIRHFVRVLGVDGAVKFLLAFGGADLYLTATPKNRSAVVALIGKEKVAELAMSSNQMQRRVPTAKPWVAAVMRSKGLSVAEISRRLHSSDVAVRGWLKKFDIGPAFDHRQGNLPL